MKKTASLGASLIATKGMATPSAEVSVVAEIHETQKTENRIAITVKLLEIPYQKMKSYGAINRKTNQYILEEALNEYLTKRNT
jgi:hypothetical protein